MGIVRIVAKTEAIVAKMSLIVALFFSGRFIVVKTSGIVAKMETIVAKTSLIVALFSVSDSLSQKLRGLSQKWRSL